jgi:hypothetical protein
VKNCVLLLAVVAALAAPAARADNLYGVLECADRVTVVDSVFLKLTGRQENPVYTMGFRGDPGETDTFDFGAQRWPDERIRVGYLYGLQRQPTFTIDGPVQHTWYDLPEPAPGAAASRIKFYLGTGVLEQPGPGRAAGGLRAEPNPLSSRTRARFSLAAPGRTRVRLFGRDGRAVRTLCDSDLGPGEHELAWDRADDSGRPVAAGVYLLRLETGSGTGAVKLVVRD